MMTDEQYNQAVSFWTRRDKDGKQMAPAAIYRWVDSFLSSHKIAALAAGADEYIRCTPLEYSWMDGALWIFTEGGLKFRALRKNRHVSAAVFDTTSDFNHLHSVQLQGVVSLVEPLSAEYKKAAEFRHISLSVLENLEEPMWLLKIVPNEITCLNSDFRDQGYSSRQFWKN